MTDEIGFLCSEGLQYLLECTFNRRQAPPTNFYIGLVTDVAVAVDTNLSALTELPSADGYDPEAVASDAIDWTGATDGVDGWQMTTKLVTFTAAGGAWPAVKYAVLKTSTDTSGKLLAALPLNGATGVTLADGEHFDVQMILQQVNRGYSLASELGFFCAEGLQFLLECGISEEQTPPAIYYVGLVTDVALAVDATLAGVTELAVANGYTPQALAADGSGFTLTFDGADGWKMTTQQVSFLPTGGAWSTATYAILKTSSDASGKLVAAIPLNVGDGITAAEGERFGVQIVLREAAFDPWMYFEDGCIWAAEDGRPLARE